MHESVHAAAEQAEDEVAFPELAEHRGRDGHGSDWVVVIAACEAGLEFGKQGVAVDMIARRAGAGAVCSSHYVGIARFLARRFGVTYGHDSGDPAGLSEPYVRVARVSQDRVVCCGGGSGRGQGGRCSSGHGVFRRS